MKLKSGAKYKILCDYKNHYDHDTVLAGTIVEVDHISPWFTDESNIRYTMVYFKNSIPLFLHEFEAIAEEVI
jgi:hypothetical protein